MPVPLISSMPTATALKASTLNAAAGGILLLGVAAVTIGALRYLWRKTVGSDKKQRR